MFNLFFLLLDISVFVGAISNINQTYWVWNNEILTNFSLSNRSVCQQMSWSLTYDDGKNLLPKDCEQDKAYFVCVQQCKSVRVKKTSSNAELA